MRFALDNYRTQSYALAMQGLHQGIILIFRFLCGRLLSWGFACVIKCSVLNCVTQCSVLNCVTQFSVLNCVTQCSVLNYTIAVRQITQQVWKRGGNLKEFLVECN
jgi:hypothetical protein